MEETYTLTKSQIKSIEIFGRQAPNGLPILLDGNTITNGYAVIRFKKPVPPEIETEKVDHYNTTMIDNIEGTVHEKHYELTPEDVIDHPKRKNATLEKYGSQYYDTDLIKRVKMTIGGQPHLYREVEINDKVNAIVIMGLHAWAAVMPVKLEK